MNKQKMRVIRKQLRYVAGTKKTHVTGNGNCYAELKKGISFFVGGQHGIAEPSGHGFWTVDTTARHRGDTRANVTEIVRKALIKFGYISKTMPVFAVGAMSIA